MRSFTFMQGLQVIMRNAFSVPQSVAVPENTHVAQGKRVADGRLYALDLARFIAMMFMMQGHVIDALVSRSEMSVADFPWNIWHFIRGFTAPIFLMVSGAVHAFATKRNEDGSVRADVLQKRIRWAFTIIGIGYILTFPASRVWDLPFVSHEGWRNFLSVNILQLTGATMLLFTLVIAGTKSVAQMGKRGLATAGALLVLTPVMQVLPGIEHLPLWLRAYLNDATGSIFPMFPFSGYLFVGLYVGSKLAAQPKEQRDEYLQHTSWRYGIVITAIGLVVQYALKAAGVPASMTDGPMSVPLFVWRVGVVLMVFSAAVWVLNHTWHLRNWYSLFDTKSLWIYIIHLLILFGTPWTSSIGRVYYHSFSAPVSIAIALGIVATTLVCAWLFDLYSKQSWASRWRNPLMYSAYAALILTLLV